MPRLGSAAVRGFPFPLANKSVLTSVSDEGAAEPGSLGAPTWASLYTLPFSSLSSGFRLLDLVFLPGKCFLFENVHTSIFTP